MAEEEKDALDEVIELFEEERKDMGWTKEYFSLRAGLGNCSYAHMTQRRNSPSVRTLEKLARALGLELDVTLYAREITDE